MARYTDEQVLTAISAALQARDMPAVVDLLRVLAVQAPDKAQVIYDAIVHRTLTVTLPLEVVR